MTVRHERLPRKPQVSHAILLSYMRTIQPHDPTTTDAVTPAAHVDPTSLYPAAKTADERHEDALAMEQAQEERRPKYVGVKFASCSSMLFFAILWLSLNTESILMSGGGLPGVSMWFLAGLVLLYGIIACARYISEVCYRYGASHGHMFMSYLIIFSFLYGGSIGGVFNSLPAHALLPVITSVHWVAVLLCTHLIITRSA